MYKQRNLTADHFSFSFSFPCLFDTFLVGLWKREQVIWISSSMWVAFEVSSSSLLGTFVILLANNSKCIFVVVWSPVNENESKHKCESNYTISNHSTIQIVYAQNSWFFVCSTTTATKRTHCLRLFLTVSFRIHVYHARVSCHWLAHVYQNINTFACSNTAAKA